MIKEALLKQKLFFSSGRSRDLEFRRQQLVKLRTIVSGHSEKICQALRQDLGRAEFESYGAEVAPILEECKLALKNLHRWARPKRQPLPIYLQPGSARIHPEPFGHVLIISPWNYPFSLSLIPAIGALAAGNVVSLKPSELAPHSSKLLTELIRDNFDGDCFEVFEGDVSISQSLLAEPFDYIFFTGSPRVGKIVMQAASQHLTPLTLELGGKSPCLVDRTAELIPTARRICWGKFINAGQTCVAPDYLVVERAISGPLIEQLRICIEEFYGPNPRYSKDFARIISEVHYRRLQRYLGDGKILVGGQTNDEERYISPTLIRPSSLDTPLMNEEIFGPILPIIEVDDINESLELIERWPKPLALYLFSNRRETKKKFTEQVAFGGAAINDTVKQVGPAQLPFGGVGPSGMGQYHGQYSFDTFSRPKTVISRPTWIDPSFLYPPYADKLKWLKKVFR